jgi:hypothetical protein
MNKKCTECRLANFADAEVCLRCGARLTSTPASSGHQPRFLVRSAVCLCVCGLLILLFYFSLLASAGPLNIDQKSEVREAIAMLKDRGFEREAFLLGLASFKGSDNWLNASVAKEDAYAATNFPFEIITLYPDFFTYPADPTERAAILLHEAKHLGGADEHDAYAFVWQNRRQLGWSSDKYAFSPVWRNVRQQTRDNVPEMFSCAGKELNDCTE